MTATINGETYRITDSAIPADAAALRAAFACRGIADHVNALPPRSRTQLVQLFVMADGSAVLEDSRIVADVAREVGA